LRENEGKFDGENFFFWRIEYETMLYQKEMTSSFRPKKVSTVYIGGIVAKYLIKQKFLCSYHLSVII